MDLQILPRRDVIGYRGYRDIKCLSGDYKGSRSKQVQESCSDTQDILHQSSLIKSQYIFGKPGVTIADPELTLAYLWSSGHKLGEQCSIVDIQKQFQGLGNADNAFQLPHILNQYSTQKTTQILVTPNYLCCSSYLIY